MADAEWRIVRPDVVAADPELREAIDRFVPIDYPAGHRAAEWLRSRAADSGHSAKTFALVRCGRLDGFFAFTAAEVLLSTSHAKKLGTAHGRHPAILLAWVARHRDAIHAGSEIMGTAFGQIRRAAEAVGAVAMVVDPADEAVARYWTQRGFRRSRPRWPDASPRLWAPLDAGQASDG